ncbi:group III truncated hemoglobin [Sphingomonas sp. LY54]|uniref:group III truncated hemoglobin n=1 Tax=Sphingomonas sp. LY54 TaxID=3095343 RepID=UPI002D79880D|nr:group III truncated hemoglobin [Sphingomonas sp. LY54]WRP27947.1 group III truncated hemoglobin [Sphingomonas sp. LY54]
MTDAMSTPPAAAITEEGLQALVDAFYAKVRQDPLIGPIFNGAIDDWPEHLERLQAFWSSVMLGSGRYKGRPLPAHIKHGDSITPDMFHRWLALWRETTLELLSGPAAAAMQEKAMRIAESLQMGIAFHKDPSGGLGAVGRAGRPSGLRAD